MGIIHEVIKGMGDIIIITTIEEAIMEINITIGIGVGHLKDRLEIGEIADM